VVRTTRSQDPILALTAMDQPAPGSDPGVGCGGPTSTGIWSRRWLRWTDQYRDLIPALAAVDRPVPGSDPGVGCGGPTSTRIWSRSCLVWTDQYRNQWPIDCV